MHENLKIILANSYSLYLKTQNYHWHVHGKHFKMLHELFQEHYEDLAGAIDEIAERIVMMGGEAPASFEAFLKLSSIGSGDSKQNAQSMIEDLIQGHVLLDGLLKVGLQEGEKTGDYVSTEMLVARQSFHQKAIWMLKSSL